MTKSQDSASRAATAPQREPTPQPRQTQTERSLRTRDRVIAATFDILQRQGYSGATTMAIARSAGVSLGAMQHQFPTKAALMAAVMRRQTALRILAYRAAIRGLPPGIDKFMALTEASWRLIGSPELIGSMEIELAMRNDPELAAITAPAMARHSAFVGRLVARTLKNAPGIDPHTIETIRLLNNALMFGLSLERARGTSSADIWAALGEWKAVLQDRVLGGAPAAGR